ncbi:MAG: DUF3592 domain-containing protein [Alistipes senegalensis]|nr:DUF3592 domain-containing protein [Bacteroides cellulosilyticus]MCM1352586.1 DUF3592 domain-containing protein [Alistipes senegalensis]
MKRPTTMTIRLSKHRTTALLRPLFCVLGLVCLSAGIGLLRHADTVDRTYESVTGTIERIDRYRRVVRGKTRTHYDVTVRYEVDGRGHIGKVNFYRWSMRVGDPIELKYDPADPSRIEMPQEGHLFGWILFGCGVFVFVTGLCVPLLLRKSQEIAASAVENSPEKE